MNEKDLKALTTVIEGNKKMAVSACLVGMNCRYDETDALVFEIRRLMLEGKAIPICPEVLGGAPTPRDPAEIVVVNTQRKVYNNKKTDVTEIFEQGAKRALEVLKKSSVKIAVLKSKSPSCGSKKIYDGSFTHQLIDGDGVTSALFKENGIRVITEEEFICCIK